ncbi:S8 family serine peptidase [Rhizobium johnstonii]|uniref:S8 family serine peptidase n=1 Tax=Rhizobium johnstonii TaxID=3019933 RepID=UPI003F97B475
MSQQFFHAAAVAGVRTSETDLPPGILRFTLSLGSEISIDSLRPRLEHYFDGQGFDLFHPPHSDDERLAVLQFKGVAREQSTTYLLSAARELTDEFSLESCEADAAPGWLAEDELGRDAPESIDGALWSLCRSPLAVPPSPLWSVEKVKAPDAWKRFSVRGKKILVGQPDTGVAMHQETQNAVRMSLGIDIILGHGEPIDPLDASMSHPGHGTATASVVASRAAGRISGTAPEVDLVPIRCVNSVVLSSGTAVAGAIDHARKKGCNVVTMSLGGPFEFPSLKRAIEKAVKADMIVLAAAGNCVPFVVYPAWDPNVIAVAATDINDRPWRGTSSGSQVDISAPGENVYVARRTTTSDRDLSLVEPGQGTSFAVAATAGCAALWLSHHGVDAVRAQARTFGVNVQELFRAAVKQTARRPTGWKKNKMGAGVVDAVSLLTLTVDKIDLKAGVSASKGAPANLDVPESFNWRRLGPEATFLAFEAAQRSDPRRSDGVEAAAPSRASAELIAAIKVDGKPRSTLLTAPAVLGPRTPDQAPLDALRTVTSVSRSTAESSAMSVEGARRYLAGDGKVEVMVVLKDALDKKTDLNPELAKLKQQVLEKTPMVIGRLAKGSAKSPSDFKGMMRVAAEALIKLTGRPALRILNGVVDKSDPNKIGEWAADLLLAKLDLLPIITAVGRIDIFYEGNWRHLGTGTHVAKGLIMTNRHVMDGMAEVLPGPKGHYELIADTSIVFDDDAKDSTKRFKIKAVNLAGPDKIGNFVNPALLDLAILEMETFNDAGNAPPPPIVCGKFPDMDGMSRQKLAVAGYPAEPAIGQLIDPNTGEISDDIGNALHALFGGEYGVKYLSPGEVLRLSAQIADGGHNWVFAHDATSLPGSSGSPIFSLGASPRVAGLHFGGSPLRQNLAHSLEAVRREAARDPSLLGAGQLPF